MPTKFGYPQSIPHFLTELTPLGKEVMIHVLSEVRKEKKKRKFVFHLEGTEVGFSVI